ncbi:hypothetical protein BGZ95_001968 [Linnemannia exigua]|uniref:Protein Abitram n=1 Tax=Linnemannia exigua TaxID=604196 RepID=A0AAD4H3D3_9FUNG|nr:hypothetical protein BGZ95_001968 [Linnemannia exigua]
MDEHAPIVYDLTSYKEETKTWNDDPSAYLLRYYTKQYFLATNGKDLKQKQSGSQKIIDLQTGLEVLRGDQFVYQSPNKLCIIGLAPTHPLIAQPDRYKVLNIRFDTKIATALPQPTATPANSKKQAPPPCHAETVVCKIEARDLSVPEGTTPAAVTPGTEQGGANDGAEQNIESKVNQDQGQDKDQDVNMSETPIVSAAASPALSSTSTTTSTSTSTSPAATLEKRTESVDPTRVMFVVRGSISGHVVELNERLLRRGTTEITDPVVIQTMLEKASTHGFIAVVRPKVDKTEIALKDLCTMDDYNLLRQGETPLSASSSAPTDDPIVASTPSDTAAHQK